MSFTTEKSWTTLSEYLASLPRYQQRMIERGTAVLLRRWPPKRRVWISKFIRS